jgi:predicted metalloprotease
MLLEQAHRTLKQRNVKDLSAAALYDYLFNNPEVTAMVGVTYCMHACGKRQ